MLTWTVRWTWNLGVKMSFGPFDEHEIHSKIQLSSWQSERYVKCNGRIFRSKDQVISSFNDWYAFLHIMAYEYVLVINFAPWSQILSLS